MTLTIGTLTLDGPTALAPMAGYTDAGFRVLCREQGCGLVVSEMVSAEGLLRGGWATARLMRIIDDERPVGVQLYGHDPERVAEAAAACEAEAAPDLIDLNMGCPVKKVVRRGAGVALMRDTSRAVRMTAGVRAAVSCPVTVKIRSGWSADEQNALPFAEAIQDAGADAITVHARTRAQIHSGEADWGLIGQLRERLRIPVLGNGGVRTAEDAVDMLETTGVPGLMVGRAAIGNPWLFREIRAAVDGGIAAPPHGRRAAGRDRSPPRRADPGERGAGARGGRGPGLRPLPRSPGQVHRGTPSLGRLPAAAQRPRLAGRRDGSPGVGPG